MKEIKCCIAVVIPCYRVRDSIADVINSIGDYVDSIVVVDDKCPEGTGSFVESMLTDPRVIVVYHPENRGVGGAMKTGYRIALDKGADIIVKIDGDGQMDTRLIPSFCRPIIDGRADYVKGNRFYSLYNVRKMPFIRLIGNAALSFMTKLSSGYWSVFDPTNGFTAIHVSVLEKLNPNKIHDRFFFETDMLIQLGGIRAAVIDLPIEAVYGDEKSNLKIGRIINSFFYCHLKSSLRRIVYEYFLRDFTIASINLFFGTIFFIFGVVFGARSWLQSIETGHPATTGTVILATLPILLGFQMILSFLNYDIKSSPNAPLHILTGEEFRNEKSTITTDTDVDTKVI